MIKGKLLRAMIDTGSSINLMTENFGNNKEQIEKLKVFTISGSMELKTRKNAIVECLDYQIPVTQLMGPKGNADMQAAKRD